MTTNDYCSFSKGRQFFAVGGNNLNAQHNNLNLNENHQCLFGKTIQTKNVKNHNKKISNYDFSNTDDSRAKQNSVTFGKSKLCSPLSNSKIHDNFDRKESKKGKPLSKNNSTLSLHITAYENSIDASFGDSIDDKNGCSNKNNEKSSSIKKLKSAKELFIDSANVNCAFELPRQQQDRISNPEVMQFKTSQRLLNVNQENSAPGQRLSAKFPINNISGVKEGSRYKYDSKDVEFSYCNYLIDLYSTKGNEEPRFIEFQKRFHDYEGDPTGREFLDCTIIANLYNEGIISMRPIQIAALQAVFFQNPPGLQQPSDFIGFSSTGSGKTHAFLVPVAQKCLNFHKESFFGSKITPLALIFVHTAALAQNIYEKTMKLLQNTDIQVRLIAGRQPFVNDDAFHIGICTIGRFVTHIDRAAPGVRFDLSRLKYVIIDEADKMADTPEFSPVYRELKRQANFATMCFSATSSPSVKAFVDEKNYYAFCYGDPNTVSISVRQRFWHVNSRCTSKVFGVLRDDIVAGPWAEGEKPHPFDAIYCMLERDIVEKKKDIRVLIFVKRTFVAEYIANRLTLYGIPTVAVLSTLQPEDRDRRFRSFINGEVQVMTATNLLTRGTDIEVDYVINYDLPLEYSAYIHRCGRTGRNQQKGVAITCVDFENEDDYSPAVLQKIALSTKKLPDFMMEYAENTRKMRELEKENPEDTEKHE